MKDIVLKKIPSSPNTITVIGFLLVATFIKAVIVNDFLIALIALFVGAGALTFLKEK